MIAIVDYNAGNIFSVRNALEFLGIDCLITDSRQKLEDADGIILPGVGAFGFAMESLRERSLVDTLHAEAVKKPFLGICLGMQLLFEESFELGRFEGLGLLRGKVDIIRQPEGEKPLILPQMGWNRLDIRFDCPLLKGVTNDDYVYFVHSYRAYCDEESIAASAYYGGDVPALVTDGKTVFGAQFHPERSGAVGLGMLTSFAELCGVSHGEAY